MASRLGGTFYSLNGDEYTVELHDNTWGGAEYDATIRDLKIKYDGETNDLHAPIITSSCEVVFSVVDSNTEAIMEILVGAAEERFFLKVLKGSDLYWCGVVLPDLIKFADKPTPYDFTVKATDGLGRLKDVPYNDDGSDYTGWETMTGHVLNCLNKIPTTDEFWGGTDLYLQANTQWWETSQGSATATAAYQSNALDHNRVRHKVWRTIDSDGNTEYMSCYAVLRTIMRTYGARLIFSAGKFVIIEINHLRTTGPVYINQYYSDGTETSQLSNSTYDDWKILIDNSATRLAASADGTVMSGAINTYLSPAQKVQVQYRHFSTQSLFPADNYWSDSVSAATEVEDFDHNGGDARIQVSFEIRHMIEFATPSNFQPGWMKFKFILSIDAGGGTVYYLNRPAPISNGVLQYGQAEWTTDNTDSVEIWTNVVDQNGYEYITPFNMVTPPLPASGDISAQVAYVDLQNLLGQIDGIGTPSYTWQVYDFYCEVYYSGRVDDRSNTTVYEVAGEDGNSDVVKIDTVIGQGPDPNAYGYIQVQPYAGGSWYEASDYRSSSDSTYRELGTRLAYEVIARRYDPLPMLQAAIITDGTYEAHYLIYRDGPEYLFLGGTFRVFEDVWEGTWGQVDYTAPTIGTPETPVEYESYNPIGATATDTFGQPSQGPPKSPPDYGIGPAPAPDTGGRNAATGISTGQAAWATDTNIDAGDSVTAIDITSISDASSNYQFFPDDVVDVYNPFTGERQYFDVSSYTFGTITTPSTTANYNFPPSSYVLPNYDWLINLIMAIRQQVVMIPILDAGTAVTTGTHNGFWRVWQNLATGTIRYAVVSFATAGTGSGTTEIDIEINGSTEDTFTLTGTQTSQSVTLDYDLSGNELIQANVTSISGYSTDPEGLVLTLIILRQV